MQFLDAGPFSFPISWQFTPLVIAAERFLFFAPIFISVDKQEFVPMQERNI